MSQSSAFLNLPASGKIAVDRTFAEHLHRANERNLDIDKLGDAEKELGIDVVQGIIVSSPSFGSSKTKPTSCCRLVFPERSRSQQQGKGESQT